MKKQLLTFLLVIYSFLLFAQQANSPAADAWVDSVFNSLSKEERIAQLIVIRAHSNLGPDHIAQVTALINKYNVGALCFFQGGPVRQANLTNFYQAITKTPLLVTIDAEYGLGMRLDSVTKFPYQLTLGALSNDSIVYKMGIAVGEQCKRLGVHVNYAPSVDINSNPNNPVIGFRSFGEDREKVAKLGIAYMKGMQEAGIMACAKHFPGHGDTEVDSHQDLPVINKSRSQLDSLELYPFKQLIKNGVGSVMIAHLSIPAIDNTANRATSLSKNNITGLLRKELNFDGLTFTDALEMKGITKYFPAGEAAVQALLAGNDMLCLPEDVNAAINAIEKAVKSKKLKWAAINSKVKKVLYAKYALGLSQPQVIDTTNLLADLNKSTDAIIKLVAKNSVTVLRNDQAFFPFYKKNKVAYVGIGATQPTVFGKDLQTHFKADVFFFSYKDDTDKKNNLLQQIRSGNYEAIIIGIHNYNIRPANNYNLSPNAISLWNSLQAMNNTATFLFGNVLAAKNFCSAASLVAMYQDDSITQHVAAGFLNGQVPAKGKLPVTVCSMPYGSGIALSNLHPVGFAPEWLTIDSIVNDALVRKAFPGCEVYAAQNGEIVYHKAFGHFEFDPASRKVGLESLYDLASLTKVSATTIAVMKLYEEGKLDLDKTLGDYLPVAQGTDKAPLTLKDILLHQAGLVPDVFFYKETLDSAGLPSPKFYSPTLEPNFSIPVARNLYLRNDWNDTMLKRVMESPLGPQGKYSYSDNDFILLGKIVETLTGMPLDQYVKKNFYDRMDMTTTGFKPWQHFGVERVVPTEKENYFRRQLLQSYVHDEGAALFGGVSGHAGLFSDAYDLALLYQMLLNGGELDGERFFKPETVQYFTGYHSDISRRAYGFDKPEKDNATHKEPYPSALASPETFGHTGFTGTCVWVDPKYKLVYVFLSNRVYNTRNNNLLSQLGIRAKIQDAIYRALQKEEAELANSAFSLVP